MQQVTGGNWQVRGVVVTVQVVVRPGRWLWLRPVLTVLVLGAAVFLALPRLEAMLAWLVTGLSVALGWMLAAGLILAVFRIRLPWWGWRGAAQLLFRPLALLGALTLWLLAGLRVRRSPRRTVQVVRVVSDRHLHRVGVCSLRWGGLRPDRR